MESFTFEVHAGKSSIHDYCAQVDITFALLVILQLTAHLVLNHLVRRPVIGECPPPGDDVPRADVAYRGPEVSRVSIKPRRCGASTLHDETLAALSR